MRNIIITSNPSYGIQPIDSPSDERHLDIMIRNWQAKFSYVEKRAIRSVLLKDIKPDYLYYAFVDLHDYECVGFSAVKPLNGSVIEIAYEILHDHRGKGIGSICVPAFIENVRSNTDKQIIARVYSDNIVSKKLLIKSGGIKISDEESDYAQFLRRATDLFDPEAVEETMKKLQDHRIETFLL